MHKLQSHCSLLAITLALFVPGTTYGANITAADSIAGLSAEITVTDLEPHAALEAYILPPFGPEMVFTLRANETGTANHWIAGSDLEMAGSYLVSIPDGERYIEKTVNIFPDTMDPLASSLHKENPSNIQEAKQGIVVSVILRDRFSNPLSGRSVELISSRTIDSIHRLTRETDEEGVQQFLVHSSKPGEIILRAIDLLSGNVVAGELIARTDKLEHAIGGYGTQNSKKQFYPSSSTTRAQLSGQSSTFQERGGFNISIVRQEQQAVPTARINEAESMTIEVLDQNGNRFFDYEDTVYLLSTDPRAELPKDGVINFSFRDQGIKQFTLGLTFMTPGRQTLIISDSPDGTDGILGEIDIDVTGQTNHSSSDEAIVLTSPLASKTLNTRDTTVEGSGPPFINIVVTGGIQDVEGDTDIDGKFAIPIQLDREIDEHTIQVKDKEKRYSSKQRTIRTDTTPPQIIAVTYTPDNPIEETDVLLVIESEPNLQSAVFTIDGNEYALQNSGNDPGKYQVLFTTPSGSGVFDGEIILTDQLGNQSVKKEPLAVNFRGLPKVQNVIAETQLNEIALRWDPISKEENVDAYRIYVGTGEEEFLYTLDTPRPTASATVKGLLPGTTYYFSVTALQGERESSERSDIVMATVLGVTLKVTPGNGSLLIEFNSLQQDIPLSHFIMEYGTDPGKYTEQRRLNGELRAYTLRDLINGVTYYLNLTPITTTGERLNDLAASGQGTPLGGGFTISASDPVPSDLTVHMAAHPPGSQPPQTPTPADLSPEGLPSPIALGVLGLAVLCFSLFMRRRTSMQQTIAFMNAMEGRYRSS